MTCCPAHDITIIAHQLPQIHFLTLQSVDENFVKICYFEKKFFDLSSNWRNCNFITFILSCSMTSVPCNIINLLTYFILISLPIIHYYFQDAFKVTAYHYQSEYLCWHDKGSSSPMKHNIFYIDLRISF